MKNLIVVDTEYETLQKKYEKIGIIAEEQLEQYFTILDKICEAAISEGAVFQNLVTFSKEGQKLKGQIRDLTRNIANDCKNYISEVDEKDEYLY